MLSERVRAAIRDVEAFVAGRDDANPLPAPAARFVHALVAATRARRCLEIGTSYGYSTLWIAAALPEGGELVTIDREQRKHDYVRGRLADAGLEPGVRFAVGLAREVIPTLAGPFDFVLNDADKEHCRFYFDTLTPRLSPGACFVTDNVLTHPGPLGDFLHYLRGRPDCFSLPVPLGNGLELTVKLA